MAVVIKQGDAYMLPVSLTLGGESLAIDDIDMVEFHLGEGIRKEYPSQVTYDGAFGTFYVPITQQETFALPENEAVFLDVRVKFNGGNVMGTKKMICVTVLDAVSREVI